MTKTGTIRYLTIFLLGISLVLDIHGVRHARNLIWTQTPSLKAGVSRIVGIEGDPTEWVPSANVQVRHISAPHVGWQFNALAFNYATQTLYWTESTNKKVQGLRLNGTTETETIFTGTSNMANGLAVDWVSNNIYWTDSLYNWIIMAPLNSADTVYRLVVRTSMTNPHSIAVHPQKGYLFWTDWGVISKIEVSDLLGNNRRTIVDTDIEQPRGIAIDYENDLLYWVDSKKDTIESADFNGNNRKVVAFQSETMFNAIAIYKNYIFVTEQLQGHMRVYDKTTGNNEINYQLGYIPDGVVMYDDSLQLGNSSDCEARGCDQICVDDPLVGPVCRCGEGYILGDDGLTCAHNKKFGTPSHIYAIREAICLYPVNLPDMSLHNVTLESQCFLQNGRGHFGLTYDAREHVLYYSENVTNSIGRINLEIGELGETIIKGVGEIQGMALDWVTGNLFWTDRTYNHIAMARKDSMYPTTVIEKLDKPLGIAVHPGRGEVYWTEQGRTKMVFMANMDGSNKRALVNRTDVEMPNHLYLDIKNDRLYWADSAFYSIRCIDLKTGDVEVTYENVGQQVSFFGISLYQDYILWTDNDDQKNGIHAARLDKQEKVRGILHPQAGLASDLITFDINNQPNMTSACGFNNGFCEHVCIPTSNTSYICACGVGYTMDENHRTCSSSVQMDDFVLAADSYHKQIYQIGVITNEVHAIPLSKSYRGVAVDVNPITNMIYWSDNKANVIMTSGIDGFGESVFRRLPNDSVSDGLAVDYINQLLFYTCTMYDVIVVVSLREPSIYKTIVNDSMEEPRDILVNSELGMIYWTDWGSEPKIEMATMDGANRSILYRLQNNSWPNAIAMDTVNMNIFWADAKTETINRINVYTKEKKLLYSEPRAHFFGLTLMGQYLYVTDWFRKHISRLSVDGGNLEQVGPSKFARLNGIASFNKSGIRTVFSICLQSTCSNLCLPVSKLDYICACGDEGKNASIPCRELNEIPTVIAQKQKSNERGNSPAMAIGLSVLAVVVVLIIAFLSVYAYKRFRSQNISHDRLVEDTSRVDTFYRITFPDPGKDEPNFDSGIENPSFTCSSEDVRSTGNIVRYSPM